MEVSPGGGVGAARLECVTESQLMCEQDREHQLCGSERGLG